MHVYGKLLLIRITDYSVEVFERHSPHTVWRYADAYRVVRCSGKPALLVARVAAKVPPSSGSWPAALQRPARSTKRQPAEAIHPGGCNERESL